MFLVATKNEDFKFVTDVRTCRYAKLATPKQIEAWKLINDDCEDLKLKYEVQQKNR